MAHPPTTDDFDAGPDPLPPRKVNGKPNIEYHRERQRRFDAIMDTCMAEGKAIPFNGDTMQKSISASAVLDGFTPQSLKDLRSEADKIHDAVNRLLEEDGSHF